jgi:hypothetical protein
VTAQAQRILNAARRRLPGATHSKPPRTSGMEPERQRHRHVGRREQRRGDGERRADDRDLHLDPMREGERCEQLGTIEVESSEQRRVVGVQDLPRSRLDAVDGQASGVGEDQWRRGVKLDEPIAGLVAEALEPVGPGVQERDAHERPRADVRVDAAPGPQQLLAGVGQRGAEHARLGHPDRLQI